MAGQWLRDSLQMVLRLAGSFKRRPRAPPRATLNAKDARDAKGIDILFAPDLTTRSRSTRTLRLSDACVRAKQ